MRRLIDSARRLRAETREALRRHRRRRFATRQGARGQLWQSWPGAGGTTVSDRLRTDVLRIIQDHPNGVGALEVGNTLGVDWRLVLTVGRTLADTGLVDQVDHDFYPMGKAGRPC